MWYSDSFSIPHSYVKLPVACVLVSTGKRMVDFCNWLCWAGGRKHIQWALRWWKQLFWVSCHHHKSRGKWGRHASCSDWQVLEPDGLRVVLILLQQYCSALCVNSAPLNVQLALGIAGLTEERVKAACWRSLSFSDLQALWSKGDKCSPECKNEIWPDFPGSSIPYFAWDREERTVGLLLSFTRSFHQEHVRPL